MMFNGLVFTSSLLSNLDLTGLRSYIISNTGNGHSVLYPDKVYNKNTVYICFCIHKRYVQYIYIFTVLPLPIYHCLTKLPRNVSTKRLPTQIIEKNNFVKIMKK